PNAAQTVLPSGPGSIQGVVRRADNKTPIAGAEIAVLAPAPGTATSAVQVSDGDGRFSFKNIALTNYGITARREGFFGTIATGVIRASQTMIVTLTARQPDATVEIL